MRHTRLVFVRHAFPIAILVSLGWTGSARPAAAQDERRIFAGVLVGVSALSADARSVTTPTDAQVSQYKPENGRALNAFVGFHLAQHFSLQANYMWNRNAVSLLASSLTAGTGAFLEQSRTSAQHAIVADGLLYFRGRESAIRPYLGTGLSVFHFTSRSVMTDTAGEIAVPSREISSTRIGLRSAVGIDIALSRRLEFRYSFSETLSRNPIGPHLTPPGQRGLANFQNLFGLVGRF